MQLSQLKGTPTSAYPVPSFPRLGGVLTRLRGPHSPPVGLDPCFLHRFLGLLRQLRDLVRRFLNECRQFLGFVHHFPHFCTPTTRFFTSSNCFHSTRQAFCTRPLSHGASGQRVRGTGRLHLTAGSLLSQQFLSASSAGRILLLLSPPPTPISRA